MPTLSGEMFSVVNGKKVDAHIHNEILSGIDPKEEMRLLHKSYERAIKFGFSPQEAAKMYGLNYIENPLGDSPDVLK